MAGIFLKKANALIAVESKENPVKLCGAPSIGGSLWHSDGLKLSS